MYILRISNKLQNKYYTYGGFYFVSLLQLILEGVPTQSPAERWLLPPAWGVCKLAISFFVVWGIFNVQFFIYSVVSSHNLHKRKCASKICEDAQSRQRLTFESLDLQTPLFQCVNSSSRKWNLLCQNILALAS